METSIVRGNKVDSTHSRNRKERETVKEAVLLKAGGKEKDGIKETEAIKAIGTTETIKTIEMIKITGIIEIIEIIEIEGRRRKLNITTTPKLFLIVRRLKKINQIRLRDRVLFSRITIARKIALLAILSLKALLGEMMVLRKNMIMADMRGKAVLSVITL